MKALWFVAILAGCGSKVPSAHHQAEVNRGGWHIVLHQFQVSSPDRYVVYLNMIPPDGSAAVPVRSFAVTDACRAGQDNQFCARIGGPDIADWSVRCGETRLHVEIDPSRDQLTVGRSAATDPCRITTGAQTFPARGGRTLTALSWERADGGFEPLL